MHLIKVGVQIDYSEYRVISLNVRQCISKANLLRAKSEPEMSFTLRSTKAPVVSPNHVAVSACPILTVHSF